MRNVYRKSDAGGRGAVEAEKGLEMRSEIGNGSEMGF